MASQVVQPLQADQVREVTFTSVLPQIIVSVAEHHSVIVPMQMLAQRTGATLRHVGLTPDQRVDVEVRDRPYPGVRPVCMTVFSLQAACHVPCDSTQPHGCSAARLPTAQRSICCLPPALVPASW